MNTKRKLLCVTVLTMLLLAVTAGTAFAEGEQAQIDDTKYATLDAAVTAAQNGDVITLLTQDAELSKSTCKQITITTGSGNNIKQTGTVVLENVTIIGEDTGRVVMSVFGNLTLGKNVTIKQIDGAYQPAIYMQNNGILTVNDGATISSKNSTCIKDGNGSNTIIRINGGIIQSVSGRCIDIHSGSSGKVFIYKGTIQSNSGEAIVSGGASGAKLIIKGGTIKSEGKNAINGYSSCDLNSIVISGGKISGNEKEIWWATDAKRVAVIAGGRFAHDPATSTPYFASCCESTLENGMYVGSHTATLTENTNGIYHCDTCDGDYTDPAGTQVAIPATAAVSAHSTSYHAAKDATCTVDGNKEYYSCSNCGLNFEDEAYSVELENTTVPATGHTTVTDEAIAATCTATGLTEGSHCSVCGEILTAQTETEALGHTPVNDEAVAATCTATGLTGGSHCSVCGEILAAQTTVDALGHDWGSWTKVDSTTHKRICKREGCAAEETAAHTFQNRICTGCGYTKPSDHDYSGSSSGSSTVVKPAPSVPQAPAQTGYIQLTVDSLQAKVFGTPVMLDCKPFIQSDRTMVPIRYISELLGYHVGWAGMTGTVTITR